MRTESVLSILIAVAASSRAHADATIHSTAGEDLRIVYEKPSGEPTEVALRKPISATGYASVVTGRGKPTGVAILDTSGRQLAAGTVADENHYLLVRTGERYQLTFAGPAVAPEPRFAGIVVLTTLDETIDLELFGQSGTKGVKSVKVNRSLDFRGATKIPPDETYTASLTLPDGTKAKGEQTIHHGRYYVVHKTYQGNVTLSSLGYVVVPKPRAKSKARR